MNFSYTNRNTPRTWWLRAQMLLASVAVTLATFAQTERITPAGDGSFSNGATFAANGWTVANATNGPWVVGTLYNTPPFSSPSAYISLDGGVTSSYINSNPATSYFYRDITVPAGETVISLTMNWFQVGEGSWDIWQIWTAPTSVVPAPVNAHPGSGTATPVPPGIAGATYVANATVVTCQSNNTLTVGLPGTLAGTTFRLIFSWKSDTSVGGTCPAAIDNISVTSAVPSTYTASALGGLWNSPASWVGGVVPAAGNDIIIPAGSTMVVNQNLGYGNVTVAGKMQWLTTVTPSATVNFMTVTNLVIDPGGEFLAHGATNAGATVNVSGDFTNNGFANFAATSTVLNFNRTSGTQTFGGTGTFLADKNGRGMVYVLFFQSLAACSITTSQDIITWNLGHTGASLNTNNKLHVDDNSMHVGGAANRRVTTVTVNGMGSGYTSQPLVTFAPPTGIGGTTATGFANFDAVSGTVRSITITDPGNGYRTAPIVTFTGGGFLTAATAVAHVYSSYTMTTTCQGQKSGMASVTGTINIPSSQGVDVAVTNGGLGYTSAPAIGVALPTGFLNLMSNIGSTPGSGYTSAPACACSGGGAITQATCVAVVTRGQVTSVNITAGGTGYTSVPTITLTGGGGAGANAVFDPAHLPTFTAVIDASLGMLTDVTTTNQGFGYLAAPTVSLNPATGAGGATTNATLVARASIYNLINNWFTPAPTNVPHTESAFIPTNRRINGHSLTAGSATIGANYTGNLTLYGATPMPTFTGPIDMGGNTLAFDHPTYLGTAGGTTFWVQNGSISYRLFGSTAAQTRPFPFNSYDGIGFLNNLLNMGTAPVVATDGSTVTSVKATYVNGPSGPNVVGSRALRIETNGGLFGTNPTLRLSYNSLDALVGMTDQPNLLIGQSTALSGPYSPRSLASGVGALAASANRTTTTTGVGPIVSGEEYFAWYSTLPPCSGIPAPGNTTGPPAACSGVNFTLGIQNPIFGSGVTYQWQSADDAAFTVNLANLGTLPTQVTSITAAKYFRCIVTCVPSAETQNSATLLVPLASGACQCGPYNVVGIPSSNADTDMGNVTVGTINNTSNNCVTGGTLAPGAGSIQARYSNFTGFVPATSHDQGATVSFSLTVATCGGSFTNGFQIYVDWNQDGDWLDAGEQMYSTPGAGTVGNHTETGTFVVPVTATPGTTRMRVCNVESAPMPLALNYAHTGYTWGETEDYCFTVTVPVPCDAPPPANTALSTHPTRCANTNFTLSLQTPVTGSGITYQWQSADDLGFTVNVANLGTATTQVTQLTTGSKYFRCAITCNNPGGGTTNSAPVLVTLNTSVCECLTYCFGNNNCGIDFISNVTIATINRTSGCDAGTFNLYTSPNPSLSQGVSFPISVSTGGDVEGIGIWFDWNANGVFDDVTERVPSASISPGNGYAATNPATYTANVTIPLTATLGSTRMRVRCNFAAIPGGACTVQTWGETEDYCVTILPPPIPAEATATINDNCLLDNYTITVNIANFGSGSPGNIVYTVNGGSPVTVPAALGNNTIPAVGSFGGTDMVEITVTNNTIADLDMGAFFSSCPIDVVCGGTVTINHCYGNNDPRTFSFIGEVGEGLVLTFVSGTMVSGDVINTYAGSDDQGTPLAGLTGNFPDLTGASASTTGNLLYMEINSNATGSCQDGNATTWVFEVECIADCVDPSGVVIGPDACTSTITVEIIDTGSEATTGLRYIVNGGTPVDDPGHTVGEFLDIGPFTPGDDVQIFLLHEGTPAQSVCNKNLGTFEIPPVPVPPTILTSATPSTICANQSSQLSAFASGAPGPVNSYVFVTNTSGGLLPMTSPVIMQGANIDDTGGPVTAIGFPFQYGTLSYTQFSSNSNGLMRLGATPISGSRFNNPLTSGADVPMLAPWWDDLYTGVDGYVRTSLEGSSGNFVRIVEWFERSFDNTAGPGFKFQVVLYQANGAIEFRYGPTGNAYIDGASIAITGPTTAARIAVNSVTHTSSTSTLYDALFAWPGGTRLYRFIRPEVPGATYSWTPAGLLNNANIANPLASNIPATTTFTVTVTANTCTYTEDVTVSVAPAITGATITPPTATTCAGTPVTLTASPNNGVAPFTYQWTDPNNVAAGTLATQGASIGGTWTCAVTDACGVTVNATAVVTANPTPTVSISPSGPACLGQNITLSAVTNIGTSFLWTGPAPVGGSTAQNVTITGLTAAHNGTYTVTATLGSCTSPPASLLLAPNPLPVISSTTATPNPICAGQTSVLNTSATLASPLVVILNGTGFWMDMVSWTLTNSLNVVIGSGGPYGNNQVITVPLGNQPNGPFTFNIETQGTILDNQSNYSITCAGNTILSGHINPDQNLTHTGLVCAGTVSYLWSGGTFLGGINNTASVTTTALSTTTPYSVLVSSAAGCTATGNVTVNVNPLPVMSCPGNSTVCILTPAFALTGATPAGGTYSGPGVSGGNFFASGAGPGTHTITYTAFLGPCSDICTFDITVDPDTDNDGICNLDDDCPTLVGEIGNVCDANPGTGFTLGEINGSCVCVPVTCTQNLTIEIQTDANPNQITWELREQLTNVLIQSGTPTPPNGIQTMNTCVPNGCYYLRVIDSGGDGITNGGYILRTSGSPGMRLIDNRRNFTNLPGGPPDVSRIAGGEGFCVPIGTTTAPIYTSCDKLDWVTGEYLVCSAAPAVSALWNAGNTPAEATTGYEFQIFNPNGGYIFNRFRSHNVSDGFAPDNSTRACHMKINNWGVATQIPANVLMNVRVRTRINGVNANWGAACRFMIHPIRAACPLTKLTDIPGEQYYSCGTMRAWGTGNYVYARPVSGATQYQWRFRIDAESFVSIRTTTTYFIQLNWPTLPLQNGKTYQVEVRAFKGGHWCIDTPTPTPGPNWVTWGDVCDLTIDNTPMNGGENFAPEAVNGLSMYPNPNRGDQLYLSLDAVEEGVHTVSVDIVDLFGKRVSARTIPVTDGFVNTVLDLEGTMANGMYMVNITAGEQRYIERLVIQR